MSPFDSIKALPTNGVKLASTHDVEFAAYKIEGETTYAISPLKCNSFYGWIQNVRKTFSKIREVPQNSSKRFLLQEEMVAELKEKG
jgi:GMP synthase (glutamine-hydrolysing)